MTSHWMKLSIVDNSTKYRDEDTYKHGLPAKALAAY